jgi:subtilisin family serine protease
MARKLIGVLAAGLALSVPAAADAVGFGARDRDRRFVPGEALVRYEKGIQAPERRELRSAASIGLESSLSVPHTQLVSFEGPVAAAIDRLEDQPGVADAQPNYVYHALAAAPNDTHFGHLWGLGATPGAAVLPAWDRSRGSGQVIAIVDTGVDLTHPDLAGNLWTGPGGIHGHDFVDGDDIPDDFNMHGTHVAGIAAAIAENEQGVAGVAPRAQIMAVRVLDGDGSGTTESIANGVSFAAARGAGVINLSLGGPPEAADAAMEAAISQAEQAGAVVVAAAGNGGDDGFGDNNDVFPTTPCTLPNPNLICVAAVTRTGARAEYSNFGPNSVDLGAAGGDGSGLADQDVLSTKPAWTPVLSEDFEGGPGDWTATNSAGGNWGIQSGGGVGGSDAATDSPSALYQNNTRSELQKTTAVNLAGRHGCRLDYALDLATEAGFDFVGIGVLTGGPAIGQELSGTTGGFIPLEQSIEAADGRTDVRPTLFFDSDDQVRRDGAYVDNFNVVCRGQAYDNAIGADNSAAGHSYTAIAGTSMAAPHVAGVAALVRAGDPGAPPSQVVQALRNGAKRVSSMAGVTVSGGVADAVGAIDAALALPNPQPPPPPPPKPPAKPRIGGIKFSARRGVLRVVVRGGPNVTGMVTLRANITAARVRVVGRKAFTIGSSRRATVRIKLRRAARRQLRRKGRLRVTARAVVKNPAGLRAATTRAIRLRLPRR